MQTILLLSKKKLFIPNCYKLLIIPLFMLFFISIRSFFITFFVFLYIIMYILRIVRAIKKMSVNELRDSILESYHKQIGFFKGRSYYSMKRLKQKDLLLLADKFIEKTSDPRQDKEQYQLFIRENPTKSVKQSEAITYQPKTFKNPNIVDIKSIITEYPKTSHKLSKTIRQTETKI